jgi:hypothetical protein
MYAVLNIFMAPLLLRLVHMNMDPGSEDLLPSNLELTICRLWEWVLIDEIADDILIDRIEPALNTHGK